MEDINKKLKENGLNPVMAKEDEKLRVLFQLYRRSESSLQTAKLDMEKLQQDQAQEIKEVETYMENIKKLSDEREALTQGIEDENEQLKEEVESLKKQLAGDNTEITQMLIEEGLDDLSDGSPSEAVAYMLVERTRLLTELEEAKNTGNQVIANNNNQEHEKTIAKLRTEKDRIDRENRLKQQKIKDLESEVQKLQKDITRTKNVNKTEMDKLKQQLKDAGRGTNASPSSEENAQLKEAKKKLQKELTTMKIRIGMTEGEKKTLNQKVKELTDALQAEKKRKSSYEGTIIKLKAVVDKNRRQVEALQDDKQKLTDEKRSLEMRINFLETDIKTLKEKEVSSAKHNESLTSKEEVSNKEEEIKKLKDENWKKSLELDNIMVSLDKEKQKCKEIEKRLNVTEEKWGQLVQKCQEQERDFSIKLDKVDRELEDSKEEILASQEVITKLKFDNEQQMERSQTETRQLRDALERAQNGDGRHGGEESHRVTIKELEGSVEELKKDRDVLAKELQVMLSKEEKYKDWSNTVKDLEHEKRRLTAQLDDRVTQQSSLAEELRAEKRKNADLTTKLNNSQAELTMADLSSSQLKDDLRRKSSEFVKKHDTTKEDKARLISRINELQDELDKVQTRLEREKHELKWKLEREEKRCRELQASMDVKNDEISDLRRETGRLAVGQTKAEKQLTEQTRLRADVESRNKVLEEEMTKLWNQLKDMMDKLTASESAKQDLEVELEKVTSQMRLRDTEIEKRHAENFATTSTLGRVQQRAQMAERKIPELQEELDVTLLKLQAAEAQLRDLTTAKVEFQGCQDDINRLKGKLHECKITENLHQSQIEELKGQVNSGTKKEDKMRNEVSDMKHRLLATQSKLFQVEDRSKSEEDMLYLAEQGKKSLQDQVTNLQKEVGRLQLELMQNSEKYDSQMQKHEDQKAHHKSKLQQAREIFNKHKSVLTDSLMKLQEEVNLLKAELAREHGTRESLSRKHENLLSEHRDLLAKHSDSEETVQDLNRNLSTVEYRAKFLERENGALQDRIDVLSRQRVALEKLIREYRLEKQKEEISKAASFGLSPVTNGFPSHSSPVSSLTFPMAKTSPSSGLGNSISHSYLSTVDSHSPGEGLLVKVNSSQPMQPGKLDFSPGLGSTYTYRTDLDNEIDNKY
ncbi:uncharacterized protein [Amphiura filiformis]|uniref:uncharacterized protein isoform X2 n=1 Tax=Amphiura filiformis TaxID=82378 RepID=UPI003B217061